MRSAFASDVSTSLLSKSKHEMAEMMEMAKKAHTHNHTHTQSNTHTHTHNQTQALNVMTYSLTTKYGSVLDAIVLLRAYLRLSVVWVCVFVLEESLLLLVVAGFPFLGLGGTANGRKHPFVHVVVQKRKDTSDKKENAPHTATTARVTISSSSPVSFLPASSSLPPFFLSALPRSNQSNEEAETS